MIWKHLRVRPKLAVPAAKTKKTSEKKRNGVGKEKKNIKARKKKNSNLWYVGFLPELFVKHRFAARYCENRFRKRMRTNPCRQRQLIMNWLSSALT